jgi:hypothetical protein
VLEDQTGVGHVQDHRAGRNCAAGTRGRARTRRRRRRYHDAGGTETFASSCASRP